MDKGKPLLLLHGWTNLPLSGNLMLRNFLQILKYMPLTCGGMEKVLRSQRISL
jgi:hypothetical protein